MPLQVLVLCICVFACVSVPSHLHLSSLIFLQDKAELVRVRPSDQPQKKRTLTQRKLLEQICTHTQKTPTLFNAVYLFSADKLVTACVFSSPCPSRCVCLYNANLRGLSSTMNFFSKPWMTSLVVVRELMWSCFTQSHGR